MGASARGLAAGGADAGTRDALADGADTAVALTGALAALGMQCTVEARGSLAVVTLAGDPPASAATLAERALRGAVVDAAHGLGFTHVALELREEDG